MIIYGWGYFNRRDHSVIRDHCPACSQRGHFKSYRSSKFFTLYFVPVIPLGTEKIISECPQCKRALTMPLRKWTKLKKTELPAAVAKYEATPDDEAAALELLGALSGLHGRTTLLRVGPQIRAAFARNPKILAHLAGAYSHLCLDKEADAVYLEAVGLSTDEQIAAAASAHIELQKLPKPKPPHRLWQSLPVMIVPAVLVMVFASFAQKAASGRPKDAFLINGLDHPYSVVINDRPVTLQPRQRTRADMIVFGENKIAPADGHTYIPAAAFEVDVPWYRRAFDHTLVVVNPDQAAVLLWERTGYAYPKPSGNTHSFTIAAGAAHYLYSDIDFPFQVFPATIDTPADGSVVYRTRVSDLARLDTRQLVQLFLEQKQTALLQAHLRARLRSPHTDATLIHLGANFVPREEFLALAEPRLSTRPVEIEWHRAYQTLVENTAEGADLVARYAAYTAQEPTDADLAYLYGRIVTDLDESRTFFERALQSDKPSAHAANALAYYYLLEGDFARSREYSSIAVNQDPDSEAFKNLRNDVLLGCKDYDTLEREAGNLLASKNPTYPAFYKHVYRLGKLGRAVEANAEIARFLEKLNQAEPMDAAARLEGEAYLKTALACALRDREALAMAVANLAGNGWRFQQSILANDLTAALRLAQKDPASVGVNGRLILYILLAQANRSADADEQLAAAVAELAKGVSDQKLWAGWLSGVPAPEPRLATHSCYDVDSHFLYLAALAQKHPSRSAEYIERAAALKTQDSFYSLALGQVLPR